MAAVAVAVVAAAVVVRAMCRPIQVALSSKYSLVDYWTL